MDGNVRCLGVTAVGIACALLVVRGMWFVSGVFAPLRFCAQEPYASTRAHSGRHMVVGRGRPEGCPARRGGLVCIEESMLRHGASANCR